ncbi:MAG: endonuclease MutS2 [Firmicutes bacterium]|nr:endonuclease MutS2 [Bacillota bacterium]
MNNRSLKILEFNKILAQMAEFATSEVGKAMVLDIKPSNEILKIKSGFEKLDAMTELIAKYGNLYFGGLIDLTDELNYASIGGVLGISALYDIMHMLSLADDLKKIEKYEDNIIFDMINIVEVDQKLLKDMQVQIEDRDNISQNATPLLRSLYRKKSHKTDEINDKLKGFISSKDNEKYLQESIITVRDGRYVVPIKREYKGSVSGLVHDVSSSGGTYFIEPQRIVNLNNEIREIESQIEEEIKRIIRELSKRVGQRAENLKIDFDIMSELDMIMAKANYASSNNHTKPEFNLEKNSKLVDIREMFHPLIDPEKVIKTDVYLSEDKKALIITGPNTGGKTVVLKTVGLITLLAQSSCYIPAGEGTNIPIYDEVYTDIGDEQSIEQSLSTFSSHMVNIIKILKSPKKEALYLFDELGAGTDPTEGAALAMSIIDSLKENNAKIFATTHYAELKLYALNTDGVVNGSMQFSLESLKPTYNLIIGVPGKSNAFEISRKLGLPVQYIDKATEYISDNSIKFEDVLTEIETSRSHAESEKIKYENLKREFEVWRENYELEARKKEDRLLKDIEKTRDETRRIYEKAQRDYENIIKDAKVAIHNLDSDSARNIQETRDKIRKNISDLSFKKPKKTGNLSKDDLLIGMDVKIISIGQTGQLVELPNDNGDLVVQVGILKVNSNLKDLSLVDDSHKNKSNVKKSSYKNQKSMYISPEIDLRGVDTEELYDRLDKFLDDALISGLKEVTVLHGKGTGALRKATHELLKKHPHVLSFRLGSIGEGDTGVTIVTLK